MRTHFIAQPRPENESKGCESMQLLALSTSAIATRRSSTRVQTLRQWLISLVLLVALSGSAETPPHTRVALDHSRWLINGG